MNLFQAANRCFAGHVGDECDVLTVFARARELYHVILLHSPFDPSAVPVGEGNDAEGAGEAKPVSRRAGAAARTNGLCALA